MSSQHESTVKIYHSRFEENLEVAITHGGVDNMPVCVHK